MIERTLLSESSLIIKQFRYAITREKSKIQTDLSIPLPSCDHNFTVEILKKRWMEKIGGMWVRRKERNKVRLAITVSK